MLPVMQRREVGRRVAGRGVHPESRAKPEMCAQALARRAAPETGLFCRGLWGAHGGSEELWMLGGGRKWAFRGAGHGDCSGGRRGLAHTAL